MDWFILIIILGTAAYLYFFKRAFFDKHKGFIEFCIVLFTAFFAIYQVRSSTDDFDKIVGEMTKIFQSAEQSKTALKSVEKSLTDLPRKIDDFSVAIDSLNSVISMQRNELTNTLEGFNRSILKFQVSLDSISERFNKSPNLEIALVTEETDSLVKVDGFTIINWGKQRADIYKILIQIEEESLIKFTAEGYRTVNRQNTMVSYQADYSGQTLVPISPVMFNCIIEIKKGRNAKMRIIAYYTSPYANDGYKWTNFDFSPATALPVGKP